jgi:hypothetical protein
MTPTLVPDTVVLTSPDEARQAVAGVMKSQPAEAMACHQEERR